MIRLRPEERDAVSSYIHSICAIALDQSKDYLIEGRLSGVLEEMDCTSFTDLIRRARGPAWQPQTPHHRPPHQIVAGRSPPHLERGLLHGSGNLQYRDPSARTPWRRQPLQHSPDRHGHLRSGCLPSQSGRLYTD